MLYGDPEILRVDGNLFAYIRIFIISIRVRSEAADE